MAASVEDQPRSGSAANGGQVRATRLEQVLDWAAGLAPSPVRIATSCCGMSMVQGGDVFEALGTAPPAVSARSADLLIVAGSITRRQVPMIRVIHARMLEPKWVIAWGACAISGGAYDNYATVPGLSRVVPVDLVVPGCPPAPAALREALDLLRSGVTRDPGLASREHTDWPILRTVEAVESRVGQRPGAQNDEISEGNEDVDRG